MAAPARTSSLLRVAALEFGMPPKKTRGHGWKRRPQRNAAVSAATPRLEQVCLLLSSSPIVVVPLLVSGVAGDRRGAAEDAQHD